MSDKQKDKIYPIMVGIQEVISTLSQIRLFDFLKSDMRIMDGSNNLEDILLKGFLNEVEKVEMLIYNTEKSIDQCRNKAKEIEHHIATTKIKVNNITPDYSREIDSFITSYTIKCNMIIRSLLKRTFSSSFEGTKAGPHGDTQCSLKGCAYPPYPQFI